MGDGCTAQGDQLGALRPPRGVGWGGWGGDAGGRGCGDACVHMGDSPFCAAETGTTL